MMWEIDQRAVRKYARMKGEAEGRAKGLSEGRAKGLAEGRAKGLAEGRVEGRVEGRAEGLAEGRAEGRAEGIDILESLGVPSDLIEKARKIAAEKAKETPNNL